MRFVRLLAVAIAVGLMWPGAGAQAAGETYTVVQCGPLQRAANEATLAPSAAYSVRSACADPAQDYAVKVGNVTGAKSGRKGRVYWAAPGATSIVGVSAEVKLRNEGGHRARLYIADREGREVTRIANGTAAAGGWKTVRWTAAGAGHPRFVASLLCTANDVCPRSDKAKAWIRNVRLTVADRRDPVLDVLDGSLLGGGWLRGAHDLRLLGSDAGSGLAVASVAINAGQVAAPSVECPGRVEGHSVARRFSPCNATVALKALLVSSESPFVDGTNEVEACAGDFAGNLSCANRTIRVDNSGPLASFSDRQDPLDPELICAFASDRVSGLGSGQIFFRAQGASLWTPLPTTRSGAGYQARVDSTASAAGIYEFQARVVDLAGNPAETTLRQDGSPMLLSFPLRSGVVLRGGLEPGAGKRKTIDYGRPSHVAGKLTDASGMPLSHREVTVVEHFGSGALLARRTRDVETDGHGRWRERLPAGPSRRVTATFAGDQRYLATTAKTGKLLVRSRARFRTSRKKIHEGKRVAFSGRVGHLGARIPPGGKLVELQVRERPGRWNTVREAFYTNGSGKYRIGYRFGRFYTSDVRFRFRLKVTREQGWPYKAPVRSRQRVVVVKADRNH